MKNIAEQILEGLSKFYVGFQNRRVLKTMEEIEANTDEQNIPSALLLGEINNKLMFPSGTEFYLDEKNGIRGYNTDPARGADTFYPFKKEAITESSVYLYGKDSQRSFIVSFEGYTKLTYNSGGAIVTLDGASKPSSASNTEISDTRHSLVFSVNRGVDAHISYSVSN